MKVKFHQTERTQTPVRQAQISMREARSPNKPVLRWMTGLMLLGLIVLAGMMLYRTRRIHTYGVVRAEIQELRAPFNGELRRIAVRPGDRVSKGDLILVLASMPASEAEISARRALRERLEERQESLTAESEARRIQQIRAAEAEIARLTAAARDAEAERRYQLEQARIEVEKLTRFHEDKKARYEHARTLLAMDAAVISDVELARSAMELAGYNLDQARVALALAEARANPYQDQLERAQADLETSRQAASEIDFLIEKARAELEFARQDFARAELGVEQGKIEVSIAEGEAQAIEYRALFDGVVTEVGASQGSVITPDELLVTIADLSQKWIDVYVPAKHSMWVAVGSEALLHIPGVRRPVQGVISGGGGAIVQTPPSIRDYAPKMPRSLYTRVDLESRIPLLPGNVVRVVIPRTRPK